MQNKNELKELLVNEYLNRFFTFFISRVSIREDALDLTQFVAMEILDKIDKLDCIENPNAYFWSVAHNAYKNHLKHSNNYILDNDYCMYRVVEVEPSKRELEKEIMHNEIRKSLSILSGLYQKILVMFYYHELKIKDISKKLNISVEMVKFYLSSGKKKLKEIYNMNKEYGEKSFNPSSFSIYYSGIDFSRVNIWDLFKRKLPAQIVLLCSNTPKTITELAIETGCASCYLEEEVNILMDAGVLKEIVKNKYLTNFFIIKKDDVEELKQMFSDMYQLYLKDVKEEFNNNIENIKKTNIFKQDVNVQKLAWIFADNISDFDKTNLYTSDLDYPKILSCGARALIFGLETEKLKGSCGQTPTYVDDYTLWARDLSIFNTHNQNIFKNKEYAKAVIDVYNDKVEDSKENIYAELLKENLLVKVNGKMYANIAYLNEEFKKLMTSINERLNSKLKEYSTKIYTYVTKLVTNNIPPILKEYAHGYIVTLINFYSGCMIEEELIKSGFLEENDEVAEISYFTK